MEATYLTIGDVVRDYGIAAWQARRAVDALGVQLPRAGLYRLIPSDLLPRLEEELRRRGYLSEGEAARA